ERKSTVVVYALTGAAGPGRELFSQPGRMTDVEWSPDGRWVLVAWAAADQWVFLRADGGRGIVASSSIIRQLNRGSASAPFPSISGWCCR
ncbi:MAG: hypothetical protein ICV59_01760, partial [Thermoleophilia bacterium]|nr:hypothetical protein [Thermoleophilia bacterium]